MVPLALSCTISILAQKDTVTQDTASKEAISCPLFYVERQIPHRLYLTQRFVQMFNLQYHRFHSFFTATPLL